MKNMKNAENQQISKAEAKRIQDAIDGFTWLLNANLKEFKALYLKSSIDFNLKMEQVSHDAFIKRIKETSKCDVDANTRIATIEKRRQPEMLQVLEYINEANKSFNNKLASMVEKCIEAKINRNRCRFHSINGGTPSEFAFLISDENTELHARTIFACGEIKAPHFRFITTTRNK
jgi:hypothetical protein